MPGVNSKEQQSTATLRAKALLPPIPLIPEPIKEPKKHEFVKLDLKSRPTDEDLETYSLNICFFDSGSPREWIEWRKNFEKVVKGHNLTSGQNKYNMARTLLRGDALRVFNQAATDAGTETNDHLQVVLQAVTKHVFPYRALPKQKRWMRRQLRKPLEMTVRQFVTAIQDLNQDFKYFPDAKDDPSLPEDELADIIEGGCPNSWQREELIQGFDVTEHSITELMEFFERLETAERLYGNGPPKKSNKPNNRDRAEANRPDGGNNTGAQLPAKSQRGRPNDSNNHKRKRNQWCSLHETDSHDLSNCKVMQAQIERMKSAYRNKTNGNQYGGKRHKKLDNQNTEQLNAMMAKAAKQGAKEAMESLHKNKKLKKSDSFNTDNECNQFSKLSIDDSDTDGYETANSE